MGVLDRLSGQNGGGLLNGLPSWWQYQTPEADLAAGAPVPFSGGSAGWSKGTLAPQTIPLAPQVGGRLSPTTAAGPAMPVPPTGASPVELPQPQAAAQAPLSGFFNHLADGLQSVAHGGSLAGAIRGHYDDSASKQAQAQNVTAKALLARGIDPQAVNAAVQPGNSELLRSLIAQAYGPQLVQSLGSGYIYKPNTSKLSPGQSITHRGATITRV